MDTPETSAAPARQPFPSWKQALVTLGGGAVLAATACFGFLVSFGNNFNSGGNAFSALAGILFFVGLLAVLAGLVLVLVCTIRALMKGSGGRADPGTGQP